MYVEVNVNGSLNLMDGARLHGVGNFVLPLPRRSTATPMSFRSSKRIAAIGHCSRGGDETRHRNAGLHILPFVRPEFHCDALHVYGPNGRPDMMAYLVLESITKGTETPLYDVDQMYRDWTYVEDITDGDIGTG